MVKFIVSQILCIFGLFMFVLSLQKWNKKDILKWQIFSFPFYALQYLLLDAYSGMIVYCFNIIRCVVFFLFEKKRNI